MLRTLLIVLAAYSNICTGISLFNLMTDNELDNASEQGTHVLLECVSILLIDD
jgi:hypothetical protein